MGRDTFVDPATGFTYVWAWNHSGESKIERARHIEETQPSAAAWRRDVRPVRQQATATPLAISLTGRIPKEEMHRQFVHFFALCQSQTVHFYHCDGPQYEVQINRYEPQRKAVLNGERYVHDYTLEMEILGVL